MDNPHWSIADHILIGNCRTAALVARSGSIDWCCVPEFHSAGIFAALLDDEKGGFFLIQPVNRFRSSQSYISNTNVAELIFENDEGAIKLTDCFVAMEEEEKQAQLFPDHEILRIATCISGAVKCRFEYFPRSFYGKNAVKLKDQGKLGIHFDYKENICVLQTTLPEVTVGGERVYGEFILNKGDTVIFSLACSSQFPAIIPEIKTTATDRLEKTKSYWQNWIGKCKYDGLFSEWVLRSALTLKLLTHAPSGAIILSSTVGSEAWNSRDLKSRPH